MVGPGTHQTLVDFYPTIVIVRWKGRKILCLAKHIPGADRSIHDQDDKEEVPLLPSQILCEQAEPHTPTSAPTEGAQRRNSGRNPFPPLPLPSQPSPYDTAEERQGQMAVDGQQTTSMETFGEAFPSGGGEPLVPIEEAEFSTIIGATSESKWTTGGSSVTVDIEGVARNHSKTTTTIKEQNSSPFDSQRSTDMLFFNYWVGGRNTVFQEMEVWIRKGHCIWISRRSRLYAQKKMGTIIWSHTVKDTEKNKTTMAKAFTFFSLSSRSRRWNNRIQSSFWRHNEKDGQGRAKASKGNDDLRPAHRCVFE